MKPQTQTDEARDRLTLLNDPHTRALPKIRKLIYRMEDFSNVIGNSTALKDVFQKIKTEETADASS